MISAASLPSFPAMPLWLSSAPNPWWAVAWVAMCSALVLQAFRLRRRRQRQESIEAQYQSLLVQVGGMTYRRAINNKLLFISDGVYGFTGWTAQECLKSPHDFLSQIHPEDRDTLRNKAERLRKEGGFYAHEFRLIHRDGSVRWLLARVHLVKDSLGQPQWVEGIATDITERKIVEQALQASEEQVNSLMRNVPGIVLRALTDERFTIQFINNAVEQISGWPAAEFLDGGKSYLELIHPDDVPSNLAKVAVALEMHGSYSIEYRLRHRDGHYLWAWGRGSATYNAQNEPIWIDGIVMDITERKKIEEALHIAKSQAETAASTKTTFLANMSHEIRTPMNAIIGFTELLLGTQLSPLQRRHMGTVKQSAGSLLGLLNNILDTAKLEKGAVELESKDFSLKALIVQAIEALHLTAETKGEARRYKCA